MTRKRAQSTAPVAESAPPVPVLGPARYTVARFLSNCTDQGYYYLVNNWREGNQLQSDEIPSDCLPPVVILACYARQYGVDLVDDYVHLLDRYWEELREFEHPDKYFSSCIVILDETGGAPSDEAFEGINIPNIYEELFP